MNNQRREQKIIREATNHIRSANLYLLQELYSKIDFQCDLVYIFKHVFLNACIYDQHAIIRWLFDIAKNFSTIDKIRIKDVFIHSKYKLKSFNKVELENQIFKFNQSIY